MLHDVMRDAAIAQGLTRHLVRHGTVGVLSQPPSGARQDVDCLHALAAISTIALFPKLLGVVV